MEPQIRYCTTSDGVSIAWGEVGAGPALLSFRPTPFTHVQEYFTFFESYFGTLARSFRLVTFDARGTGMSERAVEDVSVDTVLLDACAVIEAAKLDRFAVEAGKLLGDGVLATFPSAGLEVEDRGEQEMKGVGEPVRVYAVRGQN